MISVEGLSRYYGSFLAVNGISFSIKKGEIVGLLGPNGAGKSTTIRMLTTFLNPSAGSITIGGTSVYDDPTAIKKMIGYIPESAPLYRDMVVFDYLQFIAKIQEVAEENIAERVAFVVNKCGLSEVIHKKIGELSKGYKQRVGLAHAIIHNPEILILDEPTSGLDPNQIIEIRELILELGKEKTVILSSHILSEVQATCSRVIIINRGTIVADGSTEALLSGDSASDTITLVLKADADHASISQALLFGTIENAAIKDSGGLKEIALTVKRGTEVRDELYRRIKETPWVLYEMKKENRSLEDLFQQLTKEA